ncbi:collagen alpha-1(I) chain-like isoform X1 [Haemorhous mexicanus]|uniref:collagen alpha-1(I) chain-like isoform X1 n=1 Tax=Haemorhous mexicanus TaxID=30427 RepID=UPI0028BD56C6|nr:collagen alpha-1(I) chain-like isoform X1 [Haemorhous mexicanus]
MAGTPPTVPACSSPSVQPGLRHSRDAGAAPAALAVPAQPGIPHCPDPIHACPLALGAIPWLLSLHPCPQSLCSSPGAPPGPGRGPELSLDPFPLQVSTPSSPSLDPLELRGSSPGAAPGPPLGSLQQHKELPAALPALFPHSRCVRGHPSAHLGSPAPGAVPSPLLGLARRRCSSGKLLLLLWEAPAAPAGPVPPAAPRPCPTAGRGASPGTAGAASSFHSIHPGLRPGRAGKAPGSGHGQSTRTAPGSLGYPGPGADGRHPPGRAAQPPGQRIRPRCHLLAGALLPHPAAPPVPPGPGRFPGCHRAAGHGNHPAAASPALRARLRRLSLRADADHDLLRRLVPHGRCLRVRVAPHRPRGASPAPGSAAGAEPLPGERLAGNSLRAGLAGARADAPGAAARPRHLRRRHRARGALGRLQRHLQPLLLQLSPPDPSEPGHLLPVRRGQKRGAGGENHLPAVPAAGARLLLAPVPAGAAPLPGERGAAAARPGPGRRLRGQERPQRPQSLAVFPAGFPALLDASLPPHRPLLHQHQPCLALCALRVRSPECVPAGLPAQSGLRLDEGELPTGGAGPEPLPAEPRRGQGFLRRLPGGCFLSSHLIPFPGGCSHLIPFPGGCFLSSHLIPFPGGCSLDSHLIPLPGGCFLSSHLIPFPGGCSHLIPFPGGCSHLIPFPGGCSHLIPFPGGCSHLIPFPGGCSLGSHLIPFPGGCSHLIPFPGGCSHLIPFLGGCSLGSHLIPFPGCSPKPRQDLHIPSSSGNPGMAGWEGTSEPLQCHLPRLPVSWQGPLDAAPRAWSGLGRAQVGLGRSHSTGGTCGPSLLETSHLPQTHRDGAQNPGTTEAGVALEGLRGLFPPKPFRLWDIGLAGDGVWPPWEECKAKSISLRENS